MDRTFLGAAGCGIFQGVLTGTAVPVSPTGTAMVPFGLPAAIRGAKVLFQCATITPGANPANLLTSRFLAVYP